MRFGCHAVAIRRSNLENLLRNLSMAKNKGKKVTVEATEVDLNGVPIARAAITHKSLYLNAQLDTQHRAAFVALKEGLRLTNRKLKNGKVVNNGADAIRWLLEQIPVELDTTSEKERWSKVVAKK